MGKSLLSGLTSGHKKLTLISGGRYYRNFTVLLYVLPESTASVALRHSRKTLGSLSTRVFETRTATGSKLFSLLTFFTRLQNIFSPSEMIGTKIWGTPQSWHAKCSLLFAVRVLKTHLLKLPIFQAPCSLKTSIFEPKKSGEKTRKTN